MLLLLYSMPKKTKICMRGREREREQNIQCKMLDLKKSWVRGTHKKMECYWGKKKRYAISRAMCWWSKRKCAHLIFTNVKHAQIKIISFSNHTHSLTHAGHRWSLWRVKSVKISELHVENNTTAYAQKNERKHENERKAIASDFHGAICNYVIVKSAGNAQWHWLQTITSELHHKM